MVVDSLSRLVRCAGVMLLLWNLSVCPAQAKAVPDTVQSSIGLAQLPPEGQQTYRLIHLGGPFTFEKDGVVFGNRERILPQRARGYYHEYTVKTPGERTRGARRIVCGGQEVQNPQNCYYSDDHYASFREILDPK